MILFLCEAPVYCWLKTSLSRAEEEICAKIVEWEKMQIMINCNPLISLKVTFSMKMNNLLLKFKSYFWYSTSRRRINLQKLNKSIVVACCYLAWGIRSIISLSDINMPTIQLWSIFFISFSYDDRKRLISQRETLCSEGM